MPGLILMTQKMYEFFDQAFCEDCDGECNVEEVEVPDEDEVDN